MISELETFFEDGLIDDVLHVVKSGKEATVYCCRVERPAGPELLAAKVYRSRNKRSFKNDSVYREGRVILDQRVRRAVAKKTRKGREAAFGMWMGHEFEALSQLRAAGADVPQPIACAESAMLMEYIGDEESAAPPLCTVEVPTRHADTVFRQILWNVERFLNNHHVHGDLSAFNILYWEDRARIIDFPQSVDPRFNRSALALLERDVANVCDYFARYGVRADPYRIARAMWTRYTVPSV